MIVKSLTQWAIICYDDFMIVVGIDEAGRGCWAGPLVAAAVIMGKPIEGLKDSKKTTKAQRLKLAQYIKATAKSVGVGWVSALQVDALGLTKATSLAMNLALENINRTFDCVIIDGNYNYLPDRANVETLIGGDNLLDEVSAASIIAKTERDKFMTRVAEQYPGYGFDKHVGYGTSQHSAALMKHGICELHRKSFRPIQDILELTNV